MQPNPVMMIIRIGLQHHNPGGLIRLGVPSLSQVVITEITTLYHMITNLNINAFYTSRPFLNPYVHLNRAVEGLSLWGRATSNIGYSPTSQMYQDREARGNTTSPRSMPQRALVNQLSGMIIPGVVVTSQYIARCMENLFHWVILGGLERGPDVDTNVPNGVVLSSALTELCRGPLGSDAANGDAFFVGLAVLVGINGNEEYEGRLSGLHPFTELATRHLPAQAPPRSLDELASQHVFSGQETTQAIRQLQPAIPEVPAEMAGSVMSYDENESVPIGGIVYGDERVPAAAPVQAAAAAAEPLPQAAVAQGAPAPVHVAAAAAQPPVDLEQAAPAEAAPQAAAVQQAPPAQQLVRRRGDIRNFFGGV